MKKDIYINLEIKDYVIRIVAMNSVSKEILKFGEHFIPRGTIVNGVIEDQDTFIKILRMIAKKWKLKKHPVRLTMPDSAVIIRKQLIPENVVNDEIQQYVTFALGETIHLPFDRPVIETRLIEETAEGKQIMIISTDEEIVARYQSCFQEARLKLATVDISPLSYYRLLENEGLIESDQLLLIQYHVENVVFTAFEGEYPIFTQQFSLFDDTTDPQSYGPTLEKEDISRQEVMEQFEEINAEMERIQRFYQYSMQEGKSSFSKIALVGDMPYLDEIKSELDEQYGIPIIELDEERFMGPKGLNVEKRFHQALGLAMRAGI